jgi:two-component system, NtrC family, nitrogen regulation sensor histidine kinase NtrY
MIDIIKKNILLTLIFIFTLSLGFLTFLTFIDKSFITLNELNLQLLLTLNIILLFIFFGFIFIEIKRLFSENINNLGSKTNRKYIAFFSLFTLLPSILIALFSLFLFSFALDKYLDKKITTAVNNSYEIAKNYVEEIKNKIESDIILISFDLNKSVDVFYDNPKRFRNILKTQKLIRGMDEIHLIDSSGNLILSSLDDSEAFLPPSDEALEMIINEARPLKIINAFENRSAAIIKLSGYIDTNLYVVKFLDEDISRYLTESQTALNFYYTVQDKRTGIKISFILIYIILVSLLLFLSISIAIKFSSKFFISISNLIAASNKIGKGDLDTKVPQIKSDSELELLINNFNIMIERLKAQQEKLLLNERHEAWEHVARKLAHEIKNPLTPIQLTIDRLKTKYLNLVKNDDKDNFDNHLKTIAKQIQQIENLVNEFSDFARMPKPIFKNNDIVKIINESIFLVREIDESIEIDFINKNKSILFYSDNEQISRVFFNLIKNSIESIQEKYKKEQYLPKKITIELIEESDYIEIIIRDNGVGLSTDILKKLLNPYFTTKAKGSGLGLSIVNKIINDHNGTIKFLPQNTGAEIKIKFNINVN